VVDKYPSSVSQAFVCSVTMCLSLWMWDQIVLHFSIGENEPACGIFELLSQTFSYWTQHCQQLNTVASTYGFNISGALLRQLPRSRLQAFSVSRSRSPP
jgi:hypothetical protein